MVGATYDRGRCKHEGRAWQARQPARLLLALALATNIPLAAAGPRAKAYAARRASQREAVARRAAEEAESKGTKVAIFVARFGGWPSLTPLLLKSFGLNRKFDFILLGDVSPGQALPPNVVFRPTTLDALAARLSRTVGLKVGLGSASNRTGGWSSAKVNDLKPMFGEAFEDVLAGYGWWGYIQVTEVT